MSINPAFADFLEPWRAQVLLTRILRKLGKPDFTSGRAVELWISRLWDELEAERVGMYRAPSIPALRNVAAERPPLLWPDARRRQLVSQVTTREAAWAAFQARLSHRGSETSAILHAIQVTLDAEPDWTALEAARHLLDVVLPWGRQRHGIGPEHPPPRPRRSAGGASR